MEPIIWLLIPITKLQIAIFCYKVQMFCKYVATLAADSHQTHIPKSDIVLLLLGIKSDCNTNQYQNLQFSCHSVETIQRRKLFEEIHFPNYFFYHSSLCSLFQVRLWRNLWSYTGLSQSCPYSHWSGRKKRYQSDPISSLWVERSFQAQQFIQGSTVVIS